MQRAGSSLISSLPRRATNIRSSSGERFLQIRNLTNNFATRSSLVSKNQIVLSTSRTSNVLSRKFHSNIGLNASVSTEVPVGGIIQFKLADIGEGIAECEVLKWNVKEGDKIAQFDPICEVQSDKATVEITSRYDGVITKLHYKKGEMAKVGSPLIDIDTSGSSSTSNVIHQEDVVPANATSNATSSASSTSSTLSEDIRASNDRALATPAVRHLARKHNINLANVIASGRDGRVLKEDILKFVNGEMKTSPIISSAPKTAEPSAQKESIKIPSIPVVTPALEDKVVPLSGYSRIMVKTMTAAIQVPHFGYCDEIRVDEMISLRSKLKALAEKQGIKLTYMPIIIKATSMALLKYPTLNSSYSESQNAIIYKGTHNIGVAMDTPNGLVVPNIKNVQSKSILEIAMELTRLQNAASKAALAREDLTGGTFTLSNIGTIGGTYASPVLVVPEVCIGAIGKIQKLPRFDEKGNVIAANFFNISWSADHRVIDGATMANFSNLWKLYLENPTTMLLESK